MENYFLYAYYDDMHRLIGVYKEGTPVEIIEKAKQNYSIIKTIRWKN